MLPPLYALAVFISLPIIGFDLYARRVPNALLLAGLFCGGCWLLWAFSPSMVADALLGLMLGLVSMFPLYALRWMGAGDVKFFAVLGFLLGWRMLVPVWAVASILCGIHALTVLAARSAWHWQPSLGSLPIRLGLQPLLERSHLARKGREGLPFAAHLGIAVILMIAGHAS